MLSIGTNPTVSREKELRTIEVHILNFDSDIYGDTITVVFRKRLRNEVKFKSVDQLATQMERDKADTLELFT
jgi:riboflavin kinase/FMN adenylyltransferase